MAVSNLLLAGRLLVEVVCYHKFIFDDNIVALY